MKQYTKEQLVKKIWELSQQGWHRSVKKTRDLRNDGAVGNTLEVLLGISENNLPVPNAREWELKGQRAHTSSLVTLKHIEPSPTAMHIVSKILLPYYGWEHQKAGDKYPRDEKSFRSTTGSKNFTNRGFRVVVDRGKQKVRFVFDPSEADLENSQISFWLKSVDDRIGLGSLDPEPYWGFEDLRYPIGSKLKNCFYVVADAKVEDKHEFFLYKELYILSGFSFEKFLRCIENDRILIDFDARTGHNHGTKFRIRQGYWKELYEEVTKEF